MPALLSHTWPCSTNPLHSGLGIASPASLNQAARRSTIPHIAELGLLYHTVLLHASLRSTFLSLPYQTLLRNAVPSSTWPNLPCSTTHHLSFLSQIQPASLHYTLPDIHITKPDLPFCASLHSAEHSSAEPALPRYTLLDQTWLFHTPLHRALPCLPRSTSLCCSRLN